MVKKISTFTLGLKVLFKLRTFSQDLATVIEIFSCSILYFEMYINSLNVECKVSSTVVKIHENLYSTCWEVKQQIMSISYSTC